MKSDHIWLGRSISAHIRENMRLRARIRQAIPVGTLIVEGILHPEKDCVQEVIDSLAKKEDEEKSK